MEGFGLYYYFYNWTPSIANVRDFALPLVITFNLAKIIAAVMLINGERRVAKYLLYHYPLRLLMYYNIFSEWRAPRLLMHDGSELAELREFHGVYRMRECYDEI